MEGTAQKLRTMGEHEPVTAPLLEVRDLKKHFPTRGGLCYAVDGVSFDVGRGETYGLVGESGCGKTTVGRTVLRLLPATGGTVSFEGKDVFRLSGPRLRALRRDMQIVFQDPYSSLDPRKRVSYIVAEPLAAHGVTAKERRERVSELLRVVGLEPNHASRYPHEFSGGQRQRIGIARALALSPKLVICDEPVSALDVSIQSQVLNLLIDLQERFGLAYIFVAHGLHVIKHVSRRVGVMYLGKLVEEAPTQELFDHPLHPYTQSLISAVPVPDPTARIKRIVLQGDVPSPINPPPGCRFHTRCRHAMDRCRVDEPALKAVATGHSVSCFLHD